MKVLIVDNYDSFTYNLKQLLDWSGMCSYGIAKADELTLKDVKNYDKIIISPGPGLPSDVPVLKELILEYHYKKPILGVCLGCQAIAETFGGKLYNLGYPVHGIRKKSIITNQDLIFKDFKGELNTGLYHSWAVSKEGFPAELEITSESEDGIIMSLRHRSSGLRGIQFHPESIMTENGQQIINNWLSL